MNDADDVLRDKLQRLLKDGLKTEVEPRAYTSEVVAQLIGRLQAIPPDRHADKLTAAGVTLTPYVPPEDDDDLKQSCETCMYFAIHRQYCDLPELNIPVGKDWSCRLWRI